MSSKPYTDEEIEEVRARNGRSAADDYTEYHHVDSRWLATLDAERAAREAMGKRNKAALNRVQARAEAAEAENARLKSLKRVALKAWNVAEDDNARLREALERIDATAGTVSHADYQRIVSVIADSALEGGAQ